MGYIVLFSVSTPFLVDYAVTAILSCDKGCFGIVFAGCVLIRLSCSILALIN